jgi:hypothetical protein
MSKNVLMTAQNDLGNSPSIRVLVYNKPAIFPIARCFEGLGTQPKLIQIEKYNRMLRK